MFGIGVDWQAIRDGFDFSYLLGLLQSVIPALLCITLHELAHGLAALRLGDTTAKDAGRLTLNPLKHLDAIGLLMMLTVHMGWAKPVPVNLRRFQNPKRDMALTALAGPVANVLIALVFLFLYGLLYRLLPQSAAGDWALETMQLTAVISVGLAVFNLLPFPPLDGSKIAFSLLSDENYRRILRYERCGSVILLALVWSGILGTPLSAAINAVYKLLFPAATLGWKLAGMLM